MLSNRIAERRRVLYERMTRTERTVERLIDRSKSRIGRADAALAALPSAEEPDIAHARPPRQPVAQRRRRCRHQLVRARSELSAQERMLQSLSYKERY